MTDDKNLIARLKQAEHRNEAFGTLLKTYGDRLYWHIRRIVVSHDDAEDVMQETAVKILTSIDGYRGESSLLTWLFRIATNEALQHLRRECHVFQSLDALGESLSLARGSLSGGFRSVYAVALACGGCLYGFVNHGGQRFPA